MATASTSPRASKPWPMPAGCSFPTQFMITSATGCPLSLRIWASSRSRISARPMRVYRVRDASTAAKSPATPALPVLPLPDKPSIAVLPFANISGDPEEEYFIDGMVEEIDLPVQNIDLRLAGRTLWRPAALKNARRAVQQLLHPVVDLVRMNPELTRQLGDRPVTPDRRQRHLRLEPRVVLLPCPLHALLLRLRRFLGAGLHLSLLSHFRGPPQSSGCWRKRSLT